MKSLTRFIGTLVVVLVLAGFVLFKLNERDCGMKCVPIV